jgi:hypothetical protein
MEKVLQKKLLGIVFALGFAVFQYEKFIFAYRYNFYQWKKINKKYLSLSNSERPSLNDVSSFKNSTSMSAFFFSQSSHM